MRDESATEAGAAPVGDCSGLHAALVCVAAAFGVVCVFTLTVLARSGLLRL